YLSPVFNSAECERMTGRQAPRERSVDRVDGIRRVEPDEFVELARQIRVEIMAHAFGGGTVHDADRTLGPDRCELLSNFRTGRVAQADAHRTDAAVMEDSF